MNILLLASHAVAEYDDLRMFTDLGFDCFAPGGYEVPSRSGEGIRPALPDAPHHPELLAAVQRVRAERGEPGPAIDWGKAALPDEVIDWADAIIVHHFPDRWIGSQWGRIKHKRVVWRTCGQSNPALEAFMAGFEGLQIVRYSPAERRYFESVGSFAGEDALIRFGKYPSDYGPWTGEWPGVINITQNLAQRGDACGYGFWADTTAGMARWSDYGPEAPWALPIGEGSEAIGGTGAVSYEDMLDWLRRARVYLYTGTRPASYTLGLIEAMLTGIPVVSIGARTWGAEWDGELLFEGYHDLFNGIYPILPVDVIFDEPLAARREIYGFIEYPDKAATISQGLRSRAISLFGIDTVSAQWRAFLS